MCVPITAHFLALLCPRRERPSRRRAAEKRDELAPFSCSNCIAASRGGREMIKLSLRLGMPAYPSAPPILTASNGDGALGCNRVPGDAA
jgi:hypothetical protein